ncbi:2'-5' RNA ligase [Allocatelliglobosispora scoriae]|uniref:2'-5' RNA ligase n=1 Tax=Allocatelliglobosispora scoriae TaxID=643052 RepID=A0A841BIM5_9ACTN|nr:2'-5' RNA ligase family protein [Allocatelliglobosispora scoriae]MBB5866632.1 2'-5' RNA ligase [Allocatelliglobosispora scoriae]
MTHPGTSTAQMPEANEEFDRFSRVEHLANHWARPIGPSSYYWYTTFEHDPGVQALAQRCQDVLDLPYYDMTPPQGLHMTLERIAFSSRITPEQLEAVAAAVEAVCQNIAPISSAVGHLAGTPSALGFTAYPRALLKDLRNRLRVTTLAVHPAADLRPPGFHPHIAIAYCNTDGIPAAETIAAVAPLTHNATTTATIQAISLVHLTRRPRAYEWTTVRRIRLEGTVPPVDSALATEPR